MNPRGAQCEGSREGPGTTRLFNEQYVEKSNFPRFLHLY